MARSQLHNSIVRFRVADGLLADVQAKADRDGMSLSELIRQAIRKEVRGGQC